MGTLWIKLCTSWNWFGKARGHSFLLPFFGGVGYLGMPSSKGGFLHGIIDGAASVASCDFSGRLTCVVEPFCGVWVRRVLFVCAMLSFTACADLTLNSSRSSGPLDFFSGLISSEDARGSMNMPSVRAQRLPDLPIVVNSEVRRELGFLLRHNCAFIRGALQRRRDLYPTLSQILDDEGVSQTFLNVALIESGFKNDARSYAGAVGLWQFMRSTARLYGLRVSKKEDQRRDPILATIAAARHFRDLYRLYGDWHLALAAYNAGTGSVERAMRRAKSSDFWTIARRRALKTQTIRYVPRIIAASIIVRAIDSQPERAIEDVLPEIQAEYLSGALS